jgi:uncharacterized protein
MKYIYLHGFASSPASRKATFFATKLREAGCAVEVPHLEAEGFRNLTITGQLAVIRAVAGEGPVRLIGSSMGGYLAALYAAMDKQVDRVLLLAPAFGFAERWHLLLGEERMAQWKREGYIEMMHYAKGEPDKVGYCLIEDGLKHPAEPDFKQPGLIYHGVKDDVVPVEFSRAFVKAHANAELREVEAGHEMTEVMELMWEGSREFLLG